MVNENNSEAVTTPEKPFTEKPAEELKQEETAEKAEENKESESETLEDVNLNIVEVPESEPEKEEQPEKKELKKPAVIAIIASVAAALTVLVLVLIFAVIIPASRPKVDVSNYLKVVFDSGNQFEEDLSGYIAIDKDAIMSDFKDKVAHELTLKSSLDMLLYQTEMQYTVQGDSAKSGAGVNGVDFHGLSKDDVLTVTVSWLDDSDSKKIIDYEESLSGINLEKAPVERTINIADYAEEQGIEFAKPVTLDILDYIKNYNLIVTVPDENGLRVGLDSFETVTNGYTLRNGSLYGDSIIIYDKNMKYYASVYLDFSVKDTVLAGDKVTVDYSEENSSAKEHGFLLAGGPVEYTVTASEALSADSAKKNLTAVKEYFSGDKAKYDSEIAEKDTVEINSVYYSACRESSEADKLVIVYTNKTKKYSKALTLSNHAFFSGGRFVFYGYGIEGEKVKTADEAVKSNEYINGKNSDYTAEKLG